MSTPYIGEIRMFAGNFAPNGWMLCQGQVLPISQYDTLFQLIGTTYGGDGHTTFALPDLQGRIPVHPGPGFTLGEKTGTETVTLNLNQLPAHTHTATGQSGAGDQGSPAGNTWAQSTLNQFSNAAADATMNPASIQAAGGSQPHENRMPYLAINFIIALFGVFPTQN
jgi:microcystin-dependent protein